MKSIICLIMLMLCTLSRAATPIDGLYSNVFGGYAYLPGNVNHSYDGNMVNSPTYQGGFEAGASIGYKSNPMRYEGEVTYIRANLSNFYLNNIQQTSTSGYTQTVLAMANIYYDFVSLNPLLQPYIGGGIGGGWLQSQLKSTSPSLVAFSAKDWAFSYQGIAGITFNFAENYALNLNYRYIATANLRAFGTIFQAQIANVGATYRFDGVKYK
ncbi:MAG: porin family protein [Legionellaceae bacterium]|nr:porin family protein [Legionellaceae bacterium]MBP9775774.1 porin family protein [Legionellaceae bacterium]